MADISEATRGGGSPRRPGQGRRVPSKRVRRRRAVALLLGAAILVAIPTCLLTGGSSPSGDHRGGDGTTTTTFAGLPASGKALDPSLFSQGSCMAFPPTAGNRHKTVFLDAGHGGIDPGAVGTTETGHTIYEADQTLPVALEAMKVLRADGFEVVISRTRASTVLRLHPADVSGTELSLQGALSEAAVRDVCANLAKASALVGIYFDAGSSPYNAGCMTTYDPYRPFWRSSRSLATLVQQDVLGALNRQGWGIPDAGVLTDAGLGSNIATSSTSKIAVEASHYHHILLLGPAMTGYFSTPSEMPGVIVEPLFITDPFEGSIAARPSGQHVIADAVALAIEQYLVPVHG
jgi:N-acetylmuramoyl-L-alanine amidase